MIFLALYICLFWTFHINRIITVSDLLWLDSFTQYNACKFYSCVAGTTASLFLLLNNIPLYRYTTFCLSILQLIDIGVVFIFWLLWIILLWTSIYKFLCGPRFLFLFGNDALYFPSKFCCVAVLHGHFVLLKFILIVSKLKDPDFSFSSAISQHRSCIWLACFLL